MIDLPEGQLKIGLAPSDSEGRPITCLLEIPPGWIDKDLACVCGTLMALVASRCSDGYEQSLDDLRGRAMASRIMSVTTREF